MSVFATPAWPPTPTSTLNPVPGPGVAAVNHSFERLAVVERFSAAGYRAVKMIGFPLDPLTMGFHVGLLRSAVSGARYVPGAVSTTCPAEARARAVPSVVGVSGLVALL